MTLPREGVAKGMMMRVRMRMRRRRRRKKKALEARVKQQAREAPQEERERARAIRSGTELEVETGQLHLRVERDRGEEKRWQSGQEEGLWGGEEGAEWQQLIQGGTPEGMVDLWGSREAAADWRTGRASVGKVMKSALQGGTQQQEQRNESQNPGQN